MKILHALRVHVCSAALVAAVFSAPLAPVLAHHSFTMFDMTKRLTLTGTVTSFEWTNPHAYIEIDVPDEKGAVKHWSIELGSPSILMQSGWKFSSIKTGDKVTLIINPDEERSEWRISFHRHFAGRKSARQRTAAGAPARAHAEMTFEENQE